MMGSRGRRTVLASCCSLVFVVLLSVRRVGGTATSSSTTTAAGIARRRRDDDSNDGGSEVRNYDFDKLSALSKRLGVLEGDAPETMRSYYDPRRKSFCNRPGEMMAVGLDHEQENRNNNRRVCVTSTCYALLTLVLSSDVYDSIISYYDETSGDDDATTNDNTIGGNDNDKKNDSGTDDNGGGVKSSVSRSNNNNSKIPIRQVVRTLLASEWRQDDLFQAPLICYTILKLDTPNRSLLRSVVRSDPNTSARIKKLLQVVLNARPHRRSGTQQAHSDYIYYQVCKVLAQLQDNASSIVGGGNNKRSSSSSSGTTKSNGNGATGTTTTITTNTTTTDKGRRTEEDDDIDNDSHQEENIGFGGLPVSCLPDGASSEVFWALLRCAEVSSNEMCRQLAYRTAGDYNSFDVIRLAYSLLTYITSTSSISYIAGTELVQGKGPAPETKVAPLNKRLVKAALAAFFEEQNKDGLWPKGQPIYKSLEETGDNNRYTGSAFVFPVNTVGSLLCALPAEHFRPHLAALERTLEWIETHQCLEIITDYCDRQTGQCYGKPLKGWSSPHLPPDNGPQAWPTAQCLKCVSWMKRTIRQLMHNDVLQEFNGVAYSKHGVQEEKWNRLLDSDCSCQDGGCRTLKSVLEERIVEPFSRSFDSPSYGAAYSSILFGPPGTAKTSICEALAQRMGYDFVVIDTAVFLADGLSNVSARIRYVFRRLMALRRCIILFDEIEEFALDRETPGLSMESRMLTTGMLTAINDLRSNKQSLFFVATNRLRAFDSAITRPGRFDCQLFVGTPNLDSRISQFRQKLATVRADEEIKDRAVASYRTFLEKCWTKDAMYMNYLEGMQFASACADLVAASGPNHALTESEMSKILNRQVAVMTVRGSARDEYVASMGLSRF